MSTVGADRKDEARPARRAFHRLSPLGTATRSQIRPACRTFTTRGSVAPTVAPMHAMQVAVAGGRELEVVALGSPEGRPVLYFHGAGGTPLRGCPEALATIERSGVRLLCLSRPGFGGSCPQPGRRLTDHPADVARAADALGLERFVLLSGGAHGGVIRALGPRGRPPRACSSRPEPPGLAALACAGTRRSPSPRLSLSPPRRRSRRGPHRRRGAGGPRTMSTRRRS
jgi:pimeloyl-ACP methyl ester carboxylesterase